MNISNYIFSCNSIIGFDFYIQQDILNYLDVDSRIITKRICHSWNDIIEINGIKNTRKPSFNVNEKDMLLFSGCCDGSYRKINSHIPDWNFEYLKDNEKEEHIK